MTRYYPIAVKANESIFYISYHTSNTHKNYIFIAMMMTMMITIIKAEGHRKYYYVCALRAFRDLL